MIGLTSPSRPAFGDLISHVFCRCTKEQMGRITARRVVALVANKESIRNRAVHEFIDDAMRPSIPLVDRDLTITTVETAALPFPTSIRTARPIDASPDILGTASFGVCPALPRAIQTISVSEYRWIGQKDSPTSRTVTFKGHESILRCKDRAEKVGRRSAYPLVEPLIGRFLAPMNCMFILPRGGS